MEDNFRMFQSIKLALNLLRSNCLWAVGMLICSIASAGTPAIELVPVVVWQGVPVAKFQAEQTIELRKAYEKLKFVHAISPVYVMRGSKDTQAFRASMSDILKPGDGVAMHIAPLREWSLFSRVKPGAGQGLYGQLAEVCERLCGLEQELAGVPAADLDTMIATALEEMDRAGFGKPHIALFEEGIVPTDLWNVVRKRGFEQDWSGFNMDVVANLFGRYPLYQANRRAVSSMSEISRGAAFALGRSLDQIRFGLVLEAVGIVDVNKVVDEAIAFAKAQGRTVAIPLVMSGSSLVHTQSLVTASIEQVYAKAREAQMDVKSWSQEGNSSWSQDVLKQAKDSPSEPATAMPITLHTPEEPAAPVAAVQPEPAAKPVAVAAPAVSPPIEQIAKSEPKARPEEAKPALVEKKVVTDVKVVEDSQFEQSLLKALPSSDDAPSEQDVIHSPARQMSH